MAGIENLIGYGNAQVLPKPSNAVGDFASAVNQQRQDKLRNERYAQQQKRQDEKELYDVIGDQFNPKNFNTAVHDTLRQAASELAAKIKQGGMDYGNTYMEAIKKAGEIGQLSDKLNKLDAQLSATRNEYEKFDKRLNTPAIEFEARKRIYNALKSGQPLDESINYFDEALNDMGENAVVGGSDAVIVDFLPDEKQKLSGGYQQRNAVGRVNDFDYDVETYPSVYDVKQGGDTEAPTVITRSEPSGLKDDKGNDIPMLSDDAYRRYTLTPSNRKALDTRILRNYGNVDLRSPQAETLRKIEAYKEAERNKPRVNAKRKDMQPIPKTSNSFYFGNGAGGGAYGGNRGNAFDDMANMEAKNFDIKDGAFYKKDGSAYSGKVFVDGKNIPATWKSTLKAGGIDDKYLIKGVDVVVEDGVIKSISNNLIGTITREAMEGVYQPKMDTEPQKSRPLQFSKNDKPEVKPQPKPKPEDLRKKYNY